MQSTLRLASSKYLHGRTCSIRQLAGIRNDISQIHVNASVVSCRGHVVDNKSIHTGSTKGPLCQETSVKTQLKQVSNVDTPERIRQAWFHPEFPVENMTALLVSKKICGSKQKE